MNQELHWRSLPADPDQDPRPRQRCRHLTLLLPGLQGFVDTGSATDPTDIPSLSSTLVVFGGMGGEAWFNDVQLLTIDESGEHCNPGFRLVCWQQITGQQEYSPAGVLMLQSQRHARAAFVTPLPPAAAVLLNSDWQREREVAVAAGGRSKPCRPAAPMHAGLCRLCLWPKPVPHPWRL